jgi:hypothetical protein
MDRQQQYPIDVRTDNKKSNSSWYKPSSLTKKMFRTLQRLRKQPNHTEEYRKLRKEYQMQVRKEKRQQFQHSLNALQQCKSTKALYQLLRRTKPRAKWNSNIGAGREDELLGTVIPDQDAATTDNLTAYKRRIEQETTSKSNSQPPPRTG